MPVSVYTKRQQGLALLLIILVTFCATVIGSLAAQSAVTVVSAEWQRQQASGSKLLNDLV